MKRIIFKHRDCNNFLMYFNGKALKFVNGMFATSDKAEIAFLRSSLYYGAEEDGAIIFEIEKAKSGSEEKRNAALKIGDAPVYEGKNTQPLYPTDDIFFVCCLDGTKHASVSALITYIKERYGMEKFKKLNFLREPQNKKPFGDTENVEEKPNAKIYTAEEIEGMEQAPVVGVYPIQGEVTETKKLRSVTEEEADEEIKKIMEEAEKKKKIAEKKELIAKRKKAIKKIHKRKRK